MKSHCELSASSARPRPHSFFQSFCICSRELSRQTHSSLGDLDLWAYQRGVKFDVSPPGKPTGNAFIEAFNGRFRVECLNAHWFPSLADAGKKIEGRNKPWRRRIYPPQP